mgnify:FL=1
MRRIALVLLLASLPVTGDAATWSASQEQVPSPGPNATLGVSSRPAVADPDGNVHLVFQNRISGDIQQIVYLKRLADGTWDSPVVLSSATWSSLNPAIARDAQGGLHVVYGAALGDGGMM